MQSAYALRICIADTDRGSVRMEMYTKPSLSLSHWLKSEPFGSAKSLSQMVFTEGVSVETKLIK